MKKVYGKVLEGHKKIAANIRRLNVRSNLMNQHQRHKIKTIVILTGILAVTLLASCGSTRPVLYPNARLESVGRTAAMADIDACIRLAKEYGTQKNQGQKVAKNTAKSTAVGAATGAAVGSLYGSMGKGAATGAVGAGVATFAHGIFKSHEPSPLFKRFVEKCLREKGYEPIGWE